MSVAAKNNERLRRTGPTAMHLASEDRARIGGTFSRRFHGKPRQELAELAELLLLSSILSCSLVWRGSGKALQVSCMRVSEPACVIPPRGRHHHNSTTVILDGFETKHVTG